jgi:N-acetylneuraminic acid mutarotase
MQNFISLLSNNESLRDVKIFILLLPVLSLFLLSCNEDESESDTDGNWIKSIYFEGQPRAGSVQFTIDSKVFVGLGYNGDDYFKDFYVFDIETGLWDEIATFPANGREKAVAFAINGKGYVGLGYNRDLIIEEMKDFWEYNPATNEWKSIADFPGTARYNAVAFAIENFGYVGTGYDGSFYRSDFFSYNQTSASWEEVASFPGGKRDEAVATVSNGKAYFMSGRNNGSFDEDIWEFDPESKRWKDITPDDDEEYYEEFKSAVSRYRAVCISLNERIFIGTGIDNSGGSSNGFYEFNTQTGIWKNKTDFEGAARSNAIGYVIDSRCFVGLGQNGSSRWDDIWELKPDAEYDEKD